MLSRWLGIMAKFNFVAAYRPGKDLIPTDTLLRLILKETEDYVPLDSKRVSLVMLNKMAPESKVDLVDK